MKKFLFLIVFAALCLMPIFSDAGTDVIVDYDNLDEFDDEFDDFDALFDDAPDDIVVEEAPLPKVISQETEKGSLLKLTGSFSGKLGAAATYDDSIEETAEKKKFNPGGLIEMSNTLSLSVKPSELFSLSGSMSTSFSGKFSLSVGSLYFNTLLFDTLYVSAGKKGISWGNLKIFSNTVLSDSGSGVTCEIRYPWALGTLSGVVLFDYNKYGTSDFSWRNMNFAADGDITILNTNINAFIRKYPELSFPSREKPVVTGTKFLTGLELKRTIFGFDIYAQGITFFKETKESKNEQYESKTEFAKVTATGGFYRLWDGFTPNIGINIEYQYSFDATVEDATKAHTHLINAEFGIKKIGPAQNMKGAVKWNHDFIKESGNVDIGFIISSLIPYADWENGLKITYGRLDSNKETLPPKFEFGTALKFSLSY